MKDLKETQEKRKGSHSRDHYGVRELQIAPEGPKELKRKGKHSRATNTISGVEAEKRKH